MNHHLGKNLSLCLLYGCSHQKFSDISRSFLFFAARYTSSAVFSGHNLATRNGAPILFVDQIEIHTPISSAELRIAKTDYRQKPKLLPFRKLQPPRDFKGFPIPSHRVSVASCFLVHALAIWKLIQPDCFEMPDWHIKRAHVCLAQAPPLKRSVTRYRDHLFPQCGRTPDRSTLRHGLSASAVRSRETSCRHAIAHVGRRVARCDRRAVSPPLR
jgi:hypothetical protein